MTERELFLILETESICSSKIYNIILAKIPWFGEIAHYSKNKYWNISKKWHNIIAISI